MSLWLEPAKRTAELPSGIRMAYVEVGVPGAPVVILLHGFAASSRSFFPVLQALEQSEAHLHVFALDLRGHGDSSMPAGPRDAAEPQACFAPAEMAADVVAFTSRLQVPPAHVVGHCLGGLVAQELTLTRPDRVRSMVLIGSTARGAGNAMVDRLLLPLVEGRWKESLQGRQAGWPDDAQRLTRRDADPATRSSALRWPEDAYHLTPRDADTGALAWIARHWAVEPTARPGFVDSMAAEAAATRLGTWIGTLRSIARADHRERLKHLMVPVLLLWARHDGLFPEADQSELRVALDAAVRAGRLRYVFKEYGRSSPSPGGAQGDVGHHAHWGAPQTVAADIAAWVGTGRPTRDLPYADPADPRKLVVAKDSALLIEKGSAG